MVFKSQMEIEKSKFKELCKEDPYALSIYEDHTLSDEVSQFELTNNDLLQFVPLNESVLVCLNDMVLGIFDKKPTVKILFSYDRVFIDDMSFLCNVKRNVVSKPMHYINPGSFNVSKRQFSSVSLPRLGGYSLWMVEHSGIRQGLIVIKSELILGIYSVYVYISDEPNANNDNHLFFVCRGPIGHKGSARFQIISNAISVNWGRSDVDWKGSSGQVVIWALNDSLPSSQVSIIAYDENKI